MAIASGINGLPAVIPMHSRLFWVDGYARGTMYDGRTALDLGLLAPNARPTVAAQGAGTFELLTGRSVIYRGHNMDNGTDGGVSQPSLSSGAISGATDLRVTLPATAAAVGVDAHATHWKVYSTTDGNFNEYHYVGIVAIGTTSFDFHDTDAVVQTGDMLEIFDPDGPYQLIPRAAPYGCTFRDRLVLAGARIWSGGTAAVTNGSPNVTLTAAEDLHKGMEGAFFHVEGDTETYFINEVTAAATFKLGDGFGNEVNYAGATASYALCKLYLNRSMVQLSRFGRPEEFTGIEAQTLVFVQADDGDYITGVARQGDRVVVFKSHNIYALYWVGEDVHVHKLTNRVGCASHRSISLWGGNLIWNAGKQGVWALGPEDAEPVCLSYQARRNYSYNGIFEADVDHAYDELSSGCVLNGIYYLSVTSDGATTPDRIVVVNTKKSGACIGYWHHEDATALAAVYHDPLHDPHVQVGGHYGRLSRMDQTVENVNVAGGTKAGTFTGGTAAAPQDTGGGFYTSDDGLKGCVLIGLSGNIDGDVRFIESNTDDTLTLDTELSGLPVGCEYIIGGFDMLYRTRSLTLGTPRLKRLVEIIARYQKQATSSDLVLSVYPDQEATAEAAVTIDPSLDTSDRVRGSYCREVTVEASWREVDADLELNDLEFVVQTGDGDA